ncbi:MAG: zinc-dependent peptidase [Azoarcus sp.]|jgi:Mlc titration factor MtfA (ptsG expression regulator)|nr:zinc-dependent peptidase [Azoarcus sp.]
MFNRLKHWLGFSGKGRIIRPSPELWARVEARLPFLAYLPAKIRPRLRALAVDFLARKEFYGAHGLPLTDEIMLTIAAQACLLILDRGLAAYCGWSGIVVYPGEFIVPRREMDEAGVVHEYEIPLIGEAWPDGPVLVAWFDEDEDGDGDDGDENGISPDGACINVVIHEFAHKLDMGNGNVNGFPRLPPGMSRLQWAQAFSAAYRHLCELTDAGIETVLDPYATLNPGEFFAVASESFFETPLRLRAAFPAVYKQLAAYYGLDTAMGEAGARDQEARIGDQGAEIGERIRETLGRIS